jgi:nicotinamide riboside kinase
LFCDTNALTTWHFSQYYHQTALPRLVELAQQSASRYDVVLLCDTDIPYANTWDRSGAANRRIFQQQLRAALHTRKIPYFLLQGDLPTRVAQVQRLLARIPLYGNAVADEFLTNFSESQHSTSP